MGTIVQHKIVEREALDELVNKRLEELGVHLPNLPAEVWGGSITCNTDKFKLEILITRDGVTTVNTWLGNERFFQANLSRDLSLLAGLRAVRNWSNNRWGHGSFEYQVDTWGRVDEHLPSGWVRQVSEETPTWSSSDRMCLIKVTPASTLLFLTFGGSTVGRFSLASCHGDERIYGNKSTLIGRAIFWVKALRPVLQQIVPVTAIQTIVPTVAVPVKATPPVHAHTPLALPRKQSRSWIREFSSTLAGWWRDGHKMRWTDATGTWSIAFRPPYAVATLTYNEIIVRSIDSRLTSDSSKALRAEFFHKALREFDADAIEYARKHVVNKPAKLHLSEGK